MAKIYVGFDNLENYDCFTINDRGMIYGLRKDIDNNTIVYDLFDTYSNNVYSNVSISNLDTSYCLDTNILTNDFYYRSDFAQILISAFIIIIFIFYIPYRIISRMFGRWLKW